ncbi:hypothetical protein BH23GEM9_BH23GEM9_04630 [soil metagenome]
MRICAALCLTAVLVASGCTTNEAVAPLAATAAGHDRVAILTQDPMRQISGWRETVVYRF